MTKLQLHIVAQGRASWRVFKSIHDNPYAYSRNPSAYKLWRNGYKSADDVDRLIMMCVSGRIGNW